MIFPGHARAITPSAPANLKYSVCTLVTRPLEYNEMVQSFITAGFDPSSSEYLYIDNSAGNQCDAYAGCNSFLNAAQGEYIILCHQDILLKYDRREHLDRLIQEIDQIDPTWAVLGNAGGVVADVVAARITHSDAGDDTHLFPARVSSLDENFILVRRRANICLSHDLSGFHLYGADICQLARIIGWSAWVVNFNLLHKSRGRSGPQFYQTKRALIDKYQSALRGRVVQTTCTRMYLGGSKFLTWLRNDGHRKMLFNQVYQARKRQRITDRGGPSPASVELTFGLGSGWYAIYWMIHKISRPFQNLKRHLKRRIYGCFVGGSFVGPAPGPPTSRVRTADSQVSGTPQNAQRAKSDYRT